MKGIDKIINKFIDLIFFSVFLPISIFLWLFLAVFFLLDLLFGKKAFQKIADFFKLKTVDSERKEIIEKIKKKSLVLDVGAGNCYLAKAIGQKKKAQVVCVDVANYNKTSLPLTLFDGKVLPFQDKSFDFVILSFVLHHAKDQEKLLKECARVCRGEILVLEDEPVLGKSLFAKAHQVIYNFLFNLDDKVIYHSPSGWKKFFKSCGLKTLKEESRWGLGAVLAPMKRVSFGLRPY